MSEWNTCPSCGQPIIDSASGWRRHEDDAHGEQLVGYAASMGFTRAETEPVVRLLFAMAAPGGTFQVSMDLARYGRIPLAEAAEVVIRAAYGDARPARRLGFDTQPGVEVVATIQARVEGAAEAYTRTNAGRSAVREAQGRTLSHFLRSQGHELSRPMRDAIEAVFGRGTSE